MIDTSAWTKFATTSNADFYPIGAYRTQDPLLVVQAHASYTLRPRFWVAADGTWYRGGSSRVDEGEPVVPPLDPCMQA